MSVRSGASALWGIALGWLAGVALQLREATLGPAGAYATACVAGFLLGLLALRAGRPGARPRPTAPATRAAPRTFLSGLLCAGLIGWGTTGLRAGARLGDALDPAIEGRDLTLTGVVAALPQRGAAGHRFVFEPEQGTSSDGAPVALPRRVLLVWPSAGQEDAFDAALPALLPRAGERWRLTVRLRRPHGNLNPHGFDFELLLFEQGIRATGSVRPGPARRLDAVAGVPVQRLRQRVRDAIESRVDDPRAAGVLAALAVGDQGAIGRDDWEVFRATGVAHLMSISGLHVTMFAWLAAFAVGAAWRRSERAMLALPAPTAARWGGLALATGYAVAAGFGVPAQRTLLMLGAVALLPSLGLRWPWPAALLAAAVAVTAFDPWALLQPGFWLSFAAVGLLMASTPPAGVASEDAGAPAWQRTIRHVLGLVRGGLRTQVVATLGLAPLTLVLFQQLSLVGFVANLVAIPLVTLVVTPLALLGAVAWPLWPVAAGTVRLLADGLALLAQWPLAVWTAAAVPAPVQVLGLLGGAIAVLPLPWRLRAFAPLLLAPLAFPQVERPQDGRFELVAVDVGQGSAVLVRTRNHLLVFDAGPRYGRDTDAGQRVLLPLLRARGERRIDRLVLSHRDVDHIGGAPALLRALPVQALTSGLEPGHPLREGPVPHTPCGVGVGWVWDGVRFDVLHPLAADAAPGARPNARSCVLRVAGEGGGSALLSGDIEREQELALVAAASEALRADVLIAPHHGSRTSSSAEFLRAVQPRIVVVQAGWRNRFGHPAADVLARYAAHGIVSVQSPRCGAWTWWSGAGAGSGICERDVARRYWHHDLGDDPPP